jgi:Ca-activated chloride channel family protein
MRRDDALGERWKDSGPWLVLLLLPLALAGFRRGLFFAFPLLIAGSLALPQPAEAGWWEDLWARRDQQAHRALSEGEAERAAALARDPELSGEAWYRSGEFANAGEAWSLGESADAHYNRGNALAHLGEYDAAIAAYDAALALEPEMADALHNRELLQQMKEQQQQQQQQQESGEGQSSESESEQQQQEGEQGEQSGEGEQQEGEQDQNAQEEQSAEQTEGGADESSSQQAFDYEEAWSEEDAQAMEQWLNRIPDDPGGLLRRKFRNQHARRGSPEDEKDAW